MCDNLELLKSSNMHIYTSHALFWIYCYIIKTHNMFALDVDGFGIFLYLPYWHLMTFFMQQRAVQWPTWRGSVIPVETTASSQHVQKANLNARR